MTDWPKDNKGRLTKTFEFKNYRKSFAFTSQVAMLSEKKNHHPQIILDYGTVTIFLISHLDSLKDVVDTTLDISRKEDYAFISQ